MNIKIISQSGVLIDGIANKVILPASKGEMTVLPNHTNLISLLNTGKITIVNDQESRDFVISDGVVVVEHDVVTILVNEASSLDEDLADIDFAIEEAEKRAKNLQHTKSSTELINVERHLKYLKFKKKISK